LSRYFAVQAYAGTEVRGELPLSAPIYEIDGTSAGSRDPVTRPGQASSLRPLVGAAVLGGRDGGPLTGRLAYRRVWSATEDRLPGEPASGINDEKLSATASANWRNRAYAAGGARLNLLLGEFDDLQLLVKLRSLARQWLTLEYSYLAPTFDGDSIWTCSRAAPIATLRAVYEVGIGTEVKAYARGFAALLHGIGPSWRRQHRGGPGRRGRGCARRRLLRWRLRGPQAGSRCVGAGWRSSARSSSRGGLTGYQWRADLATDGVGTYQRRAAWCSARRRAGAGCSARACASPARRGQRRHLLPQRVPRPRRGRGGRQPMMTRCADIALRRGLARAAGRARWARGTRMRRRR
jgi:hypothetical protein